MIDFSVESGSMTQLDACYDLLMSSQLGRVYFSGKNPRGILQRGLEDGEISVVITDDGKCIGFIWVEMNGTFGRYPYLHMVVIHEDYQGGGIGTQLIGYVEKAIAPSYDKVFLLVADFNPRAKKLYESLGYKTIGTLQDFYRKGVNEFLMMKLLSHQ